VIGVSVLQTEFAGRITLLGCAILALACLLAEPVGAQTASATHAKPTAAPITSQFKAFKVHFLANGQEELEPASSVSPGDVLEYVALHRNVSPKRLLNTDFAIPIPHGTTLWQGSIQPASGKLVLAPENAKSTERAKVVWRVERLDPGQGVELKLRVSIDPDPTLAPAAAPNPFQPRRPELRKP
jgi:hypothetical protein